MAERIYYVSWIDKRTDPWPQWERLQDGSMKTSGAATAPAQTETSASLTMQLLPNDHPEWPGIPMVPTTQAGPLSDPKMGQYQWPGLPYSVNDRPCRLYLGPTIAALFHPA